MNTTFVATWPEEVTSHIISYLPLQSLPSFAATTCHHACNDDAVTNERHWQIRYLDRFGSRLLVLPDVEVLVSWRMHYERMHILLKSIVNTVDVESSHQVVEHHQWLPPPPPVQQEEEEAVACKMCCKRLCIFYIILIIPLFTIVNVVINIWLKPDIGLFCLIFFDVIVLILGLWYVIRVDGQVRTILHIS
jgi:hypothetical protein